MTDFSVQQCKMNSGVVQSSGVNKEEVLQNSLSNTNGTTTNTAENSQKSETSIIQSRINEICKILSKYHIKLSVEQIQQYLEKHGNVNQSELITMDDITFKKITICLDAAIKDSMENGKLNKEKAFTRFMGYKMSIVNQGIKDMAVASKQADALEKMDLIDYIKLKNPTLAGKEINDIDAVELKNIFKTFIIGSYKSDKAKNPKAFMDLFMILLNKCDDKEKAKIFHAFALLLKDEQMQKIIPDAYQKLITTYTNMEELAKLVQKVGPELLKELGFDDATIQIINFKSLEKLDEKQLGSIINSIIETLSKIDEADLTTLKEALAAVDQGKTDELSERHIEVLRQYLPLIQETVSVIAITANRPELKKNLSEHYKKLFELLNSEKFEGIQLNDYIFNQLQQFFEQNQNLFNNMSKDDFAKAINKISNNKYSEATGDTNPENLYNEPSSESSSSYDFGFAQSAQNTVITTLNNKQELEQQYGINPNNEKYETALASKQTDTVTSPKEKYSTIKNLTAQDIYDGLANNYIKIYDVLDNYKDLTQSAKDYINCLIEKMPASVQNYILDGVGGHEVLEIVRHINIPRKVLENITLDFNSRKELEGMEDEKITI